MDTEDDPRKFEDTLLDKQDNGDTNPGQTLPQKQEHGETSPQKEETSRIPDKEQSRKRRHSKISTLPTEERIKKAEKAIQGLKRHTDKGTCPVSFRYKAQANVKVPLRRKYLSLFSPFSCSNPFNEFVIAKIAIN